MGGSSFFLGPIGGSPIFSWSNRGGHQFSSVGWPVKQGSSFFRAVLIDNKIFFFALSINQIFFFALRAISFKNSIGATTDGQIGVKNIRVCIFSNVISILIIQSFL